MVIVFDRVLRLGRCQRGGGEWKTPMYSWAYRTSSSACGSPPPLSSSKQSKGSSELSCFLHCDHDLGLEWEP